MIKKIKNKFSGVRIRMLNLTLKELGSIVKSRNTSSNKSMSEYQLKALITTTPEFNIEEYITES